MAKAKLVASIIVMLFFAVLAPSYRTMGAIQTTQILSSSGIIQQEQMGQYTYVISLSGTSIQMKNGTTGQIKYQSTNATQVINNALGNLTQGQSISIDPGIYDLNGSITTVSKTNNIELHFEKNAILFVSNYMNAPAIIVNGNNWLIQNTTINGNSANQEVVANVGSKPEDGILISVGSCNNLVTGANITNCGRWGFFIADDLSGSTTNNGIINSVVTSCGLNDITIGQGVINSYATNNEVAYSSDVGITTWGQSSTIRDNYVHDINGTAGYNNASWGIAVESGGNDTISENIIIGCIAGINLVTQYNYNNVFNNQIENCKSGVVTASNFNTISDNKIENCKEYGININSGGNSNIVTYNNITSCGYGIYIGSDKNLVKENRINNFDITKEGCQAITTDSASSNQIIRNQIYSNGEVAHALELWYSVDTSVVNNSIILPQTSGSYYAISIDGSKYSNITNNSITGYAGIIIDKGSQYTKIYQNNLTECGLLSSRVSDQGTLTSISNNTGYNPVGYISKPILGNYITDGAAANNLQSTNIWKNATIYTNTESPKVLHISNGIVTAVICNGKTLFESTGYSIVLQPGDTFSITFSKTPTIDVEGQ